MPHRYWLMVLSFNPFCEDILKDARVNISMGHVPCPSPYVDVKIRCAELITEIVKLNDQKNKYLQTVVLQYSNSIYACFMLSAEEQTDMVIHEPEDKDADFFDDDLKCLKLNHHKVVKLKMIRGYNQNIYFAEKDGSDRTEIVNIFLDANETTQKGDLHGVRKETIYTMPASQVIALELDTSNVQDDFERKVPNSIFIIDSLQKIHHLSKKPNDKEYKATVITLPHHNLAHMRQIRWNSTPINAKIMQYDGVYYSIKSDCKWENKDIFGKKVVDYKYLTSCISVES